MFNKFLKTCKNDIYYDLNESAIKFIDKNFGLDNTINGTQILQKVWDNMYKKAMDPMRIYLKQEKDSILEKLNKKLYDEVANKYAAGNISAWEMSSLSFYYHQHELADYQRNFDDFNQLPEEPEIDYRFTTKTGQEITMYRLHTIIGTVIDKDKMRNTITLLTPTGVVLVKIYKNQFAVYDKQISMPDEEGHKKVLEKSWFSRGTLLRIQGIRRGNDFIPKKNKNSLFPIIMKIIDTTDGLKYQEERIQI